MSGLLNRNRCTPCLERDHSRCTGSAGNVGCGCIHAAPVPVPIPSEPPAADSPTPGTERRAPVQSDREHPNGSVAWWEHEQAWQDYHRRYPSQDAETIAKRAGFSYAELVDHLGHEPTTWQAGATRYVPPPAPSPVGTTKSVGYTVTVPVPTGPYFGTTEPPAEVQQDDELMDELMPVSAAIMHTLLVSEQPPKSWTLAGELARAAHAARSSADTETLRADELPFVLKLNDQDVTVAEVPDLPERGLTSLSYNYQQRIQVRSVDDLDGRVLLHEVLHALLATDPQQVCPADDPRHEDFVRMLTAGLHDAAGYRRLAARRSADTETLRRVRELAKGLDTDAHAMWDTALRTDSEVDEMVGDTYAEVSKRLRAALDAR
jgi:hypothetical protein